MKGTHNLTKASCNRHISIRTHSAHFTMDGISINHSEKENKLSGAVNSSPVAFLVSRGKCAHLRDLKLY